MQILIVNFNLDGLSEEEFESSSNELASSVAEARHEARVGTDAVHLERAERRR